MPSHVSRRSGSTLVEVMAIGAIISLLGTTIFPALQEAREAARRKQCMNNLKIVGLALQNYHAVSSCLPFGWVGVSDPGQPDVFGMNGSGWGASILPYIEQAPIFVQLDFKSRIDEGPNAKLIATPIPLFRCPTDPYVKPTWTIKDVKNNDVLELATVNYVASFGTSELAKCEKMKPGDVCEGDGLFFHNSSVTFKDVTDGMSMTFAVGERIGDQENDQLSTWSGVIRRGKHPFARILGSTDQALDAPVRHASDFLSAHIGGSYFLLADGSVRFVSKKLDLKIFQSLTTRAGGEKIGKI